MGTGASPGLRNTTSCYFVSDMVIGPDGSVYAGGEFDRFNYAAASNIACRIAKYDPDASTLATMDRGFNSEVHAVAIGIDGTVYAGGRFSTTGSVGTTANRIAQWNGTTWSSMAGGLGVGDVNAIAVDKNGLVYVGGTFTVVNGSANTARTGAVWNPNASTWSNFSGSGINVAAVGGSDIGVLGIDIGNDNTVYFAGGFNIAGCITLSGSGAVAYNGVAFQQMGTTFGGNAYYTYRPRVDRNSNLVYYTAVGLAAPTVSGSQLLDSLAIWTGTNWLPVDVNLPGVPAIIDVDIDNFSKLTIAGINTTGTASTATACAITNSGTTQVSPTFIFYGPGRVYQLTNYTTKQVIYLNLTLSASEVAELDLENKTLTTTFRGNAIGTIIPGSNFTNWRFLPGINNIGLFIDDQSASTSVYWKKRHWSIDG